GATAAAGAPAARLEPVADAPAPARPEPAMSIPEEQRTVALFDFDALLRLAEEHRDIRLKTELECFVHVISFENGRLSFRPADGAPADLASRLTKRLHDWTGARWVVSVDAHAEGAPTRRASREAEVHAHPLVKAALETFPEAEIIAIRDLPSERLDEPDADDDLNADLDDL
ncbi:MAG: DNA polymerase III subunit gamma/tau, partial [Pseudomonadota bacterium]